MLRDEIKKNSIKKNRKIAIKWISFVWVLWDLKKISILWFKIEQVEIKGT